MKLIIELSEKETATYADTISAFVRTIGGHGEPVVPVTHAAPIQIQAPAAPTPTVAPTPDEEPVTVSSNPPSVDATGLPWDERIHSATKSTVANGQWRRKKGVSDELVAQVEAELRGTVQQPATPAPAPVAADPFAQFVQQTQQPAPVAAPDPIPQPMQAMPPLDAQQTAAFFAQQPAVSQPTSPAPADFPSFMRVLAGAVASQKVDPAYINGLCQQLGIGAIADLMGNTALIPVAYNKLIADGKI